MKEGFGYLLVTQILFLTGRFKGTDIRETTGNHLSWLTSPAEDITVQGAVTKDKKS